MKRTMFLILAAVLLIPGAVLAADPITIGVSLPVLWHHFYAAMETEAEKTATELGVTLVIKDATYSQVKQALDLDKFAEQKVDAILVVPMTSESLVKAIEKIVAAGIPVATVDRKANTDKVLVHVGADNLKGGRAAARYIVEKLGNKGSVLELEGEPDMSPTVDRKKGFEEVIGQSHVKLLASKTGNYDKNTAYMVMRSLMNAFPNFDAVCAANDDMMIGAIQAMSDAGMDPAKKVTIGFDVSEECQQYVREGKLDATFDTKAGEQVRQALTILVDYIRNRTMPKQAVIYIAPKLITSFP